MAASATAMIGANSGCWIGVQGFYVCHRRSPVCPGSPRPAPPLLGHRQVAVQATTLRAVFSMPALL